MKITFEAAPEAVRVAMQWAQTQKDFPRQADKACEYLAQSMVKIVKQVIETQQFRRVPLNLKWQERKKREGLDPRILIATKSYLKSYRHYRVGRMNWAVTCDLRKMQLLEFGRAGQPKRPHYEPVMRAVNEAAPTIFAHHVLKGLGLG